MTMAAATAACSTPAAATIANSARAPAAPQTMLQRPAEVGDDASGSTHLCGATEQRGTAAMMAAAARRGTPTATAIDGGARAPASPQPSLLLLRAVEPLEPMSTTTATAIAAAALAVASIAAGGSALAAPAAPAATATADAATCPIRDCARLRLIAPDCAPTARAAQG